MNCHRIVSYLLFGILLLSLIIGAIYRATDIKKNYDIINGFEFYVDMASHFWTDPGGYNHEAGLKMIKNSDEYVFTRHPKEPATGSFENEKGWEFILSMILKEGTRGIQNLALTVVRYQFMLDIFVIILLFWAGKSIIGPLGGSFAAVLYALFKPSIRIMSLVSYYYWAIPFSALSLFFWSVIYRPERKKYSLRILSLAFLLYGMLIGFATSVRLGFLFLPLFMSSIIFFRERNIKRSMVLLFAMLIGQGILLVPQILITHRYYGKYTLSIRGKWHNIISGFGAYPNPFGIKDTGDLTAVDWAIERGGPDLNKVGIQGYDKFMKKEAIRLVKERPDIFLMNLKNNFYSGMTVTSKYGLRNIEGPVFLGIINSHRKRENIYDPKIIRFARFFPWFLLASILVVYFFREKSFWPFFSVVSQGLYLLGVVCIYFPPVDVHITSYYPVYVLLLAIVLSVLIKGTLSIFTGVVRCLANGGRIRYLPVLIKESFNK